MRRSCAIVLALSLASAALAEEPVLSTMPIYPSAGCCNAEDLCAPCTSCDSQECKPDGLLKSDPCFGDFIGPISNPVLTKDPRSLTEARFLFVENWIPKDHPLGGGNFELYGLQVRAALTERLTFIADKDGYASIHPGVGGTRNGWVNIAAGLKYTFIRDVENQFLVTGGFMYEPQTGEASVFQSHGDGLITLFGVVGKEFGEKNHILVNAGYQMPIDRSQNSTFFYSQLHLDRQLFGWLYPVFEANWFHWTDGGNRGLPAALGEGDGLLNFGTSGVAGNDLLTLAVGLKAKLGDHANTGIAYEFPISPREDLLNNRLLFEVILRY